MMTDYDLWYAMVKLPYKIKNEILEKYSTIEELWYYYIQEKNITNLEEKVSFEFNSAWDRRKIDHLRQIIYKNEIKAITLADEDYPLGLRQQIPHVPYMVFYKGDISELNKNRSVAIVGSRNCTYYGNEITKSVVKVLCENNINIVSGMAKGIDTFSHHYCLGYGGYTAAVLGSGVNVVYPKENLELYNSIAEKGCIISEFLPGSSPLAVNFPIRNNIITALSTAVIVIEAGSRSGSLITARYAAEQGKDVLAVPGNIFSEQSKGTNELIKDGAHALTSLNDLCFYLGLNYNDEETVKKSVVKEKTNKLSGVISHNPIHIDDIIKLTNIDIGQIYELLFEMQSKNEIICLAGNFYVKTGKFK
jgi:DNA processing protein